MVRLGHLFQRQSLLTSLVKRYPLRKYIKAVHVCIKINITILSVIYIYIYIYIYLYHTSYYLIVIHAISVVSFSHHHSHSLSLSVSPSCSHGRKILLLLHTQHGQCPCHGGIGLMCRHTRFELLL